MVPTSDGKDAPICQEDEKFAISYTSMLGYVCTKALNAELRTRDVNDYTAR